MNEPVYLTMGHGDDRGGRSAGTGRATELEQKREGGEHYSERETARQRKRERERERERKGEGEGERRQAFTCGRHPMMHSCC